MSNRLDLQRNNEVLGTAPESLVGGVSKLRNALRNKNIEVEQADKYPTFEELKKAIENKVVDITKTTATAEKVLQGSKFYNSEGVLTTGTAEPKEELGEELETQTDAVARLETAVNNLPEWKLDAAEVKQMDVFENILTGKPIVERDYTEKEMKKLEAILIDITGGEIVNG